MEGISPISTMNRSSRSTCAVLGGTVLAMAAALIVVVVRALTGAGPLLPVDPLPTTPTAVEESGPGDGFAVYFTDPTHPAADTYRGGPDEILAAAIGRARLTVDIAAYDLNLWSVRDALLDAHRRGVAVRMVAESDNLDRPEIEALVQAGIPVLGDRREGLMHHKFVVIDRLEVWTGSMNFTINGAYRNDNNLVRVRSSRLAQDYLTEFEEMFTHDRFGPASLPDTPLPSVVVDGVQIDVLFSPDDGAASQLVALVNGAQESVYFMAYSFTADDIALAMLGRARAGVTVSGVFETSQFASNQGTEYGNLRAAGLDVHLDENPRNMHHKVIVIDERIVVMGSYNFSASAETRNDENVLVIHSPEIAALYVNEFTRVRGLAQP